MGTVASLARRGTDSTRFCLTRKTISIRWVPQLTVLHADTGLTFQNVTPPAALRTVETGPHAHSLKDLVSLSQLVHDSIMACDVDVRASLLQNIVVVGNTSLTRGLTERLDLELAGLMPSVSCLCLWYE